MRFQSCAQSRHPRGEACPLRKDFQSSVWHNELKTTEKVDNRGILSAVEAGRTIGQVCGVSLAHQGMSRSRMPLARSLERSDVQCVRKSVPEGGKPCLLSFKGAPPLEDSPVSQWGCSWGCSCPYGSIGGGSPNCMTSGELPRDSGPFVPHP